MRRILAFLAGWLLTGGGAFAGSVLGNAGGPTWLSLGAIAGGGLGVLLAARASRRFGWLPPGDRRGPLIGGALGFVVAVPLTLTHMSSPVVPVLSCALAGAGLLLGDALSRRPGPPSPH